MRYTPKPVVGTVDYAARGQCIREARAALGLTQRQLANCIGAHPTLVNKAENGDVQIAGRPVFDRLELALRELAETSS
jgi:transcriptional regulator with XRE-family HTH domain